MKATHTILHYLLPIAFCILLVLPVLNSQLHLWEFEQKDENRNFKDSLSIDIKRLDYFPGEAELYLNDNFSFRTPLLDAYHGIKFSYFKVSPHPDKTVIGADDWFFKAGKELEIYGGEKSFSEKQLSHFSTEWARRMRYLDSLDIQAYWIIAPFKHYIYDEKLPFNIRAAEVRRVDQLKAHLEMDFPQLIIDPVPMLRENKGDKNLFYKMDNHWSQYSAYLTTKILLDRVKADFPDHRIARLPACQWESKEVQEGIHYKVLGVEGLSETRQYPVFDGPVAIEEKKVGYKHDQKWAYPWEYERRYSKKGLNTGLKILVIRDSFGKQLVPFVSEVFDESIFIFDSWEYKLNERIIEQEQPDIVVFLGLETHLENIIKEY